MREASLGFYWFPRERDKAGDIFKIQTLALSRLTLSLSLQLSPPFSSTAAASSRTATSSCGLGGSTMATRPRAPQYGNVAAASIYYASASYYYTLDLYYPLSSSWPDRHEPGYPQWCPTAATLALSHLTLSLSLCCSSRALVGRRCGGGGSGAQGVRAAEAVLVVGRAHAQR
jgi:hypothetical protein